MDRIVFPWHDTPWRRLTARAGALPHAMLLRGRSGLGKTELALRFAGWLLCEAQPKPAQAACGRCPACNWFAQNNHPDFRRVEPEALAESAAPEAEAASEGATSGRSAAKPSRQIKVDQIRALGDFLAVGTHRAGVRIALVRPAEAMNASTANALLKALEEPPPKTLFLLVSSQPARLLPTIRSRCQAIDVPTPPPEEALVWLRAQGVTAPEDALAYTGHAPLAAAVESGYSELREAFVSSFSSGFEPVTAVDRWQRFGNGEVVDALQKWVFDGVQLRVGGTPRYFPGHGGTIAASLGHASTTALTAFARRLAKARGEALHPLNPRLFLESLALELARLNEAPHVR
jgi:DNA polymerase-3 subunit delta'